MKGRALALAWIALAACYSTPTDPNAGRVVDLPPSPDAAGTDDGGDDAGDDSSIGADSSALDSASPPDTGSGGAKDSGADG